jgi:nitroreductase
VTLSAAEVNQLKEAPTSAILPVFRKRWSPRAFADRKVAPADLATVFEAARWAASSYNEQPWRFVVGIHGSTTYQKIHDSLMPFNQMWAAKAPVLILGTAKTTFSHNNTPNRVALYDLGAAASYLTLQASAIGLATHQMGGFDESVARAALAVPAEYLLGSVIALGYQAEPSALAHPQMLEQETAPRERKPHKDFVFSSWGAPADLG